MPTRGRRVATGGVPVLRAVRQEEGRVTIRLTEAGEGVTVQTELDQAGQAHAAGTVLDVPRSVAAYCVRNGFAELIGVAEGETGDV